MANDIVIFKNGELELQVNVSPDLETVWLNRDQMSDLFDRDIKTIGKHISNIFKEGELDKEVVVAKFATTTKHGAIKGKTQTKNVEFYNLDVIISVGYRVKSQRGIAFRKWATSILKDYMIKGYAVNEKRLEILNKTIDIQTKMLASTLELDESEVLNVIEAYQNALSLLDDYDHGSLSKPKGTDSIYRLTYEECRKLIDKMKFESAVFGVEKEEGKLNGILAAVYQNVFGQELYPSIEEKAANLLYFLIKDHPFADGCKRIGATIFLEFLNRNHHLIIDGKQVISDSALVAITLMIAESRPEEKETMVKLVMNFLSKQNTHD
ncbi:RhuM family protein [[Clostridium] innocuum]|uniref:RhuM family protein n=1 Tax=Clostridium innocuum TaxID=1522 RepID=UPI001C383F23|nr:RhuM family protein [[Clostridium] innocuum]MBV4171311.1 virulence RhuM family protein [[Clostridium] innocuum]